MKKRLISLFLAFDMLLSLFPISAFAETPSEQPVKVYHAQDFQGLLIAVQAINLDGGNNTISLEDDITLENGEKINLTGGVTTILGNNHTISGGENQTLWVSGSAVLNLGRQDGADKLTFEGNDQSITAVSVSGQAELNVYEGVTIENYHDSGVKVGAGAAFTMNGGTIQNCSANDGGGVKVDAGATFTMSGGTIQNCSAQDGGGVKVGAGATFTMSGGTIQNCSADDGGGVAVCGERNGNIQKVTPAVFTMSGGTILHCTAMGEGGGVAADYAEVTISGGSIKNCSAVLQGGGINFEDGTLSMSGGSIDGCSASSPYTGGGGIALQNTAVDLHLTLTGGSITNNQADNGGGGICVMSTGNFSADAVENMTITGNSASRGGGVYGWIPSVVNLSAASNILCNNTATDAGADICMYSGSLTLPDAALMNRNLGTTGHKIDGWYIDGIKADTAGNEVPRYTPNEHGEAQDVTAAVSGPLGLVASYKRVRHTITVTAPDSSYGAEAKNADGSKAESALEGEHIYLSYDDTALKENETFEKWIATDANGNPVEIKQDAAGSYYFVMPESDVNVVLSIRSADVEPDVPVEPSEDSGAAGSIIAGAVICAAGYYIGTELYLETVFGDVPANRQALASALWEKAGRPEPESTALYTDVDAQDADAQKADRWCVEQRLIPDRGEDTFRPAGWITHAECIISWKKLEKMLKSAVK